MRVGLTGRQRSKSLRDLAPNETTSFEPNKARKRMPINPIQGSKPNQMASAKPKKPSSAASLAQKKYMDRKKVFVFQTMTFTPFVSTFVASSPPIICKPYPRQKSSTLYVSWPCSLFHLKADLMPELSDLLESSALSIFGEVGLNDICKSNSHYCPIWIVRSEDQGCPILQGS